MARDRSFSLPRLIALCVFCVLVTTFFILTNMYVLMYLNGERSTTLHVNLFGEFWIEFIIFVGAMVFLPVLLYELDDLIRA